MAITIVLAVESDAQTLASIMTTCFGASDAAYKITWGAEPGPKWEMHNDFSVKGLFTPVQKEGRVTFKAVDEESGKVVGFASWTMPKAAVPKVDAGELKEVVEKKKGPPVFPGVCVACRNERKERADDDRLIWLCFLRRWRGRGRHMRGMRILRKICVLLLLKVKFIEAMITSISPFLPVRPSGLSTERQRITAPGVGEEGR